MNPIILRADALAAGLNAAAISRLLRRGRWIRLQTGVYVETTVPSTPDLRAAAALYAAGSTAVASHQTAARVHGIEIVTFSRESDGGPEHVIVPSPQRRHDRTALTFHSRELTSGDQTVVRGIPVTTPARTVRDLLVDADRLTAIWAAEDALRFRFIGAPELSGQLESAIGQRGVREARERHTLIDPRSESPLETGVRLLAHDAGLPPLQVQIPVLDGRYRIDLGYRRHRLGIECDGKSHEEIRALYSDRIRANALDGAGWRLLRFTWSDLMSRPRYIVDTIRGALRVAA